MSSNLSERLQKDGIFKRVLYEIGNDCEAGILTLLDRFNNHYHMYPSVMHKSVQRSETYRDAGNSAFRCNEYSDALGYYNMAIMHAPENTLAMAQAYSNRSALLYKMKQPKECLKDIETCLQIPASDSLRDKLLRRKRDCETMSCQDKKVKLVSDSKFLEHFKLPGKVNEKIPCASHSIDIVCNTVVAVRDIPAGEVIIDEKPYASCLLDTEAPIGCHYCHKFGFNLIPCKNCCTVMFCNEKCQKLSWDEVHKVECLVYKHGLGLKALFRTSVNAVLKAVVASSSWSDLIASVEAANKSESYIDGPYSETSYQNLCTPPRYEKITKLGRLFDMFYNAVTVVQILAKDPAFFPTEKKEKKKAMAFLGKQIIYHFDKSTHLGISGAVLKHRNAGEEDDIMIELERATGLFPFTRSIKNSCNPNALTFGLENRIIVVTIHNISKGTPITIPYWMTFFMDGNTIVRKRKLFTNYSIICKCIACRERWTAGYQEFVLLTKKEERFLKDLGNINTFVKEVTRTAGRIAMENYPKLCIGTGMFSKYPKSGYYNSFTEAFQNAYSLFQAHLAPQPFAGSISLHERIENDGDDDYYILPHRQWLV